MLTQSKLLTTFSLAVAGFSMISIPALALAPDFPPSTTCRRIVDSELPSEKNFPNSCASGVNDNTNDSIVGTSARENIYGYSGNDALFGFGGNDTIFGNQGDDLIEGGDGKDTIFGGKNNDRTFGGNGNDTIYGDLDNDELWGQDGNDTLFAGPGKDVIVAGNGDDLTNGNQGNDMIWGGEGNDIINGGKDTDVLVGDNGNYQGGGNDTLYGDLGQDFVFGENGNDDIYIYPYEYARGGYGNDRYIIEPRIETSDMAVVVIDNLEDGNGDNEIIIDKSYTLVDSGVVRQDFLNWVRLDFQKNGKSLQVWILGNPGTLYFGQIDMVSRDLDIDGDNVFDNVMLPVINNQINLNPIPVPTL